MPTRFLLLFFSTLLLMQCKNSPSQKSAASQDEVALPKSLQSIYLNNGAIFRGIEFGQRKAAVKSAEKAALRKSSSSALEYTVDIDDESFADITYNFTSGKVSKIQLDFYSKNRSTTRNTYNDIVKYCDQKYKKRKSLWDGHYNDTDFTIFTKQLSKSGGQYGFYVVWEEL